MLTENGLSSRCRSSPEFGYYTYNVPNAQATAPGTQHTSVSPPARKKRKGFNDAAWYTAGVLPPIRRVGSVPQRIEDGNNVGAGMQIGLMAINFLGDMRELELAGGQAVQVYNAAKSGIQSGMGLKQAGKEILGVFKNHQYLGQHVMTLFGGTVAEPIFERNAFLKRISDWDIPLYDTWLGKKFQKIFNLKIDETKQGQIERKPLKIPFTKREIKLTPISAYNFEGGYGKQLLGGSLHRISTLGLVAATALEIPLLVHSITKTEGSFGDKMKAFGKQLLKSCVFIGLVNTAIAVGGRMLARWGAIPSLIGMAIGSGVSLAVSKVFNKQVDKFIS